MSVADMLAAARGQKPATAAVPQPRHGQTSSSRQGRGNPAKVDPAKMSVADMLAAARGQSLLASALPQLRAAGS